MILYSDTFCDDVSINQKHYDDFLAKLKEASNYEENQVNDLIYYACDIFGQLDYSITKRNMFLKIADIIDVISIDDFITLKHFEIRRLLNATKSNYLLIFTNAIAANVERDEKNQYETVDSE